VALRNPYASWLKHDADRERAIGVSLFRRYSHKELGLSGAAPRRSLSVASWFGVRTQSSESCAVAPELSDSLVREAVLVKRLVAFGVPSAVLTRKSIFAEPFCGAKNPTRLLIYADRRARITLNALSWSQWWLHAANRRRRKSTHCASPAAWRLSSNEKHQSSLRMVPRPRFLLNSELLLFANRSR
jgi:hypothetical protein